ncbi:MAG: DUF898 family protein [Candidatus Binatia bacterium]
MDARLCPACGKSNREQARFCGHCGHPLEQRQRLSFHGSPRSLFGIFIVNVFLTIFTLGLYRFWGKVRVLRYLLSQTEFAEDRFSYHGTGKELLIGFLKIALVFGLPFIGLRILQELPSVWVVIRIVAAVLAVVLGFVFLPLAIVGARRYRLSRTAWRGIRFSFRGRAVDFLKLFVKGTLLTVLTVGLYYPVFATRQYHFLTSHSYFGHRSFHFDGRARDLWGIYGTALLLSLLAPLLPFLLSPLSNYVLALLFVLPILGLFWRDVFSDYIPALVLVLLALLLFFLLSSLSSDVLAFLPVLPILGVIWFWFFTKKRVYYWNHTSFATARFHSTLPVGRYLLFELKNLFLLVATLGLSWPWVVVRHAHFAFAYLTLDGPLDLADVQQEVQALPDTGAGFLSFLEMDFDLG